MPIPMTSMPSPSDSLIDALSQQLGAAHVLTDPAATAPYLQDWRGRYQGQARCVVRPGSTAEVAEVVRYCAAQGVPLVPQGGNTGLCGGATPDASGAAVVLSLSRLNRIRSTDSENNTLIAEAGCTLHAVQAAAEAAGRLFPLALASEGSCQIGGNLSTNAGGVQVLRYGNTRDLTLGLEVVLPDGRIWDGLRGLRKDNTGYDLKHLFIGAEGTLGIITAAVLKLFPKPAAQATAWLALPDAASAVAVLSAARAAFDARLTAFELISEAALGLVLKHFPVYRRPGAFAPWYVLCEFSADGEGATSLNAQVEHWLVGQLETGRVGDAVLAQSLPQACQFWRLREQISEAQKCEGLSIKHDISLPVSAIPRFLARAEGGLAQQLPGVRVVAFGHLGDGNLHYNLSLPASTANASLIARQAEVHRWVHDLVVAEKGSISAEHGIGQLRRADLAHYKDAVELDLMRRIKTALDPQGLMNPGKILG